MTLALILKKDHAARKKMSNTLTLILLSSEILILIFIDMAIRGANTIGLGILVVSFLALPIAFRRLSRELSQEVVEAKMKNYKADDVNSMVEKLHTLDPNWDSEMMLDFIEETFNNVMDAWTEKDRSKLKSFLSDEIFKKLNPFLLKLSEYEQTHVVKNVTISRIRLANIFDYTDDTKDSFVAMIDFKAMDYTTDKNGEWAKPKWITGLDPNTFGKTRPFSEFWTFQWQEEGCKVIRIEDNEEWERIITSDMILQDRKYQDELTQEL